VVGFGVRVLRCSSFLEAYDFTRKSGGRSFLMPCGRVSINDQSKYRTGANV